MRPPLSVLFAIPLAVLVCVALADAAAIHNSTVSGAQTAAPENGAVAVNLNATGDLPGMVKVTLQRDGSNVSGGSWSMTVLPQNADANSSETGTLTGSISGGSVTLDANGVISAVTSVQLTVQSGTGQYSTITSGNGTLNLSADAENSSKLGGPLVLDF